LDSGFKKPAEGLMLAFFVDRILKRILLFIVRVRAGAKPEYSSDWS
jgi:hypothetical protein